MIALTLRLDDEEHERLRREAFENRTSINELIRQAIRARYPQNGCDVCGKPFVKISTPGGFRFCEEHGGK